MKPVKAISLLLGLALAASCFADVSDREAQPRKALALTVYNQGFAVVRDLREMYLPREVTEMRFVDVAASIDPTSVRFRSLTDQLGTTVLEQNYEYDLVDSHRLLQKFIDRDIAVMTQDDVLYEGKLLGIDGGQIVMAPVEGPAVTMVQRENIRQIDFPELPGNFITRPTLVWLIQARQARSHEVEVSYITEGINWHADYTLVTSPDDALADLSGWVTLDNHSGATYPNATLQLMAGDVRKLRPEPKLARGRGLAEYDVYYAAERAFEEKAFFEYHLYTLQRPTTVKDRQTKQVELLSAESVPVKKEYIYAGWQGQPHRASDDPTAPESSKKVQVFLELLNSEENRMGMPLPAGRLRTYKTDTDGSLQFIGEDAIEHTPRDEKIRIYVGDAFDIVGERTQTDFVKVSNRIHEESFHIEVRNHKDEAVTVKVVEKLWRWTDWRITQTSADYEKTNSTTIEYLLPVPADGSADISYTVRYTH